MANLTVWDVKRNKEIEMNLTKRTELIKRVLAGDCTPAIRLLSYCNDGILTCTEALKAFNARLPKASRFNSLRDAAAVERNAVAALDC